MNLNELIESTAVYFDVLPDWKRHQSGSWSNGLMELNIFEKDDLVFVEIETLEIQRITIALFAVPESSKKYHQLLLILDII